jgi:hypothetical protein
VTASTAQQPARPSTVLGRPLQPGNPDGALGSKNELTRIFETMANDGRAEALVDKIYQMALEGKVWCQRMIIDRACPVRKGQPVSINLPVIETAQDVLAATNLILRAVTDGTITLGEASALSRFLDRALKAIEMIDKAERTEVPGSGREERARSVDCGIDVLQNAKPLVAPDGSVSLVDYLFTCFVLGIKPEGEPSSFETILNFESEEYTEAIQNGDLEKLAEFFQDGIMRLFAMLNSDPAVISGEEACDVYLEHMPVSWLAQLASDLQSPLNQTHKLRDLQKH